MIRFKTNVKHMNKRNNHPKENEGIRVKKKKTKRMSRVERIKKQRRKKRLLIFAFFLSFCVFVASLFLIWNWFQDNRKIDQLAKETSETVKKTEKKDSEKTELVNPPEEDQPDDYWDYIKMDLLEVDFNELLQKNSDTVGWIEVKGTNINYPVVQTTDNSYYLSHAFDKTQNDAGWVFMDYRNDATNFDQNTIIYAHSRYNQTMFGSLKNILTSSWYNNKNNYIIRMSTPTENTMWQVFSVYTIEAESYYITTNFSTTESYQEFLNTMKSRSEVNFSATVNTNDKVLTLSTCQDNFGHRVVMHAKLIKREAR